MKKSYTLIIILVFQFGTRNATSQIPNSWNFVSYNGGAAGVEMMAGCANFKIGNTVYFVGGGPVNGASQKFWKYSLSGGVGTWTTLADFPGGARTGGTAFSIGGKGYFGFGGDASVTYYNDLWEYDTITGWSVIPISVPWPAARISAIGCSIGSKGYMAIGYGYGTYYDELWEFDPLSGWTSLTPSTAGGEYLSAGFCIGNKIYIATGSSSIGLDNSFRVWDQATGVWTPKSPFPGLVRSGPTGFSLGTKGYIGTGNNGTASVRYGDFFEYDQVADAWTTVPTIAGLPSGQERFYATAFSLSGKGYIVGGGVSAGSAYNDLWQYTPLTPPAPDICVVTADTSGINNVIYWEKTTPSTVDSFIVYRYVPSVPGYVRIGAVSNDSLSMFIDTARSIDGPGGGDPALASFKYKLSIRDTFGIESPLSVYHESIKITDIGSGNFNFNQYTINGVPVAGYRLYRSDTIGASWTDIGPATPPTANDLAYSSFPYGGWRIEALGFSCNPTRAGVSTSRSNIKRSGIASDVVNVNQNSNAVLIYPNPANQNVTIEVSGLVENASLKIINSLGEKVYGTSINSGINKSSVKNIDISMFPKGLYTVVVGNTGINLTKKLIVN